jgi:hypothetical protein
MELQVRRLEVLVTLQLLTLLVVTLPASRCGGQVEPGPVLVPVHVGNTKAGVPFPSEVKYVYGTYIYSQCCGSGSRRVKMTQKNRKRS